ncbi:MAG: hypothetical protein ABW185_03965 [Sedimenticola sp.]
MLPWPDALGACPRIGQLLRKAHFGPFFRSFSLNKSNYSPQMTGRNNSKWTFLATVPILGQAPEGEVFRLIPQVTTTGFTQLKTLAGTTVNYGSAWFK